MSARHASWLVIYPGGCRWFATEANARRYLAYHDRSLGPAVLVGLDTAVYPTPRATSRG